MADTLWQLTQRTWLDLKLAPKHGSGCEKVNPKVAKPRDITDEVVFLAFRFHGKCPMVGFRDGRMFHVVWIDRNHEVY